MMNRKKSMLLLTIFWIAVIFGSCDNKEEEILIGQQEETTLKEEKNSGESQEAEDIQEETSAIWVDVSGAVKNPGVYKLENDARIFQAIEAAGGFSEDADPQWLNQAAEISDGEKIFVYTKEETQTLKEQGISSEQEKENAEKAEEARININQASLEELQEIPGIGEARAQAIIAYREETGGFGSIEDIQQVSGIKGKTFEKIEPYITVE